MAKDNFDRIWVRAATNRYVEQEKREAQADTGQTISPGMALELTFPASNPSVNEELAIATSTDGLGGPFYLALQKTLAQPQEDKNGVDATFTAGDYVPYTIPQSGDTVQVRVTANTAVAIGDTLITNGAVEDGTFVPATLDATTVVGTIVVRAIATVVAAVGVTPLVLAEVL